MQQSVLYSDSLLDVHPLPSCNYILNSDLISAQETHRVLGIIVSSDLSWREHMKNFLSIALKLSDLFDVHSALVTVLKPRRFFICPYFIHSLHIVHRFGVPTFWKRSSIVRTNTSLNDFTADYRSHLIALKILLLMMQLEIYDVMLFIRSLNGPTDAFNIYDHVTIHILALHILLTSSWNMFCQELCKTFLLQQNA